MPVTIICKNDVAQGRWCVELSMSVFLKDPNAIPKMYKGNHEKFRNTRSTSAIWIWIGILLGSDCSGPRNTKILLNQPQTQQNAPLFFFFLQAPFLWKILSIFRFYIHNKDIYIVFVIVYARYYFTSLVSALTEKCPLFRGINALIYKC